MKICEKEECFACFACMSVCPQTCITMEENDAIGHIYPIIDNDRCIRCGLCQSVCPVLVKPEKRSLEKAYAAYSLDVKEHETSTSGGVAACFSRNVISDGGVVYGCSSRMDDGISHIRVDSNEQLFLLQGSKYVHSHINTTYVQAKKDLQSGKKLLFTGTPCQIAGLRSYLKRDYDNLLTVDLICHGVPPQKLLLEEIKKYNYRGNLISFREPEGFFLKIRQAEDEKIIYKKTANKSLYFLGFNANLLFRDSCYTCPYAELNRCSDITIGDFWGLGKNVPFTGDKSNGISVVLINTQKGERFWNEAKHLFFCEERPVEEAVAGNANLGRPSISHRGRKKFVELYPQKGYNEAAKKVLVKERIKYRIYNIIYDKKIIMNLVRHKKK